MAKEMSTREFNKMLLDAGCSNRNGKGSHVVWFCPSQCGKHQITVSTSGRSVAPNAMRDVKYKLPCIKVKVS